MLLPQADHGKCHAEHDSDTLGCFQDIDLRVRQLADGLAVYQLTVIVLHLACNMSNTACATVDIQYMMDAEHCYTTKQV